MNGAEAVTDPTDWAETPVKSLQQVENALRCQVCKEFFDTPVITSCAHTFCSLCIRRCLTHDGKCPTCRANDQTIRLRRNWIVEELVNTFTKARPEILRLGREVAGADPGGAARILKRKLQDASLNQADEELQHTKPRARLQNRRLAKSKSPSLYQISDSDEQLDGSEIFMEDGKVKCPICQARMMEVEVSPHIDRVHSEPASTSSKPQASMSRLQQHARFSSGISALKPPERLSPLSYSLLNDNALRKKLGTLGIPSFGNKQLMIKRHKEWVDIWNANRDSTQPKPKRELLKDLDAWERTQGGMARNNDDMNAIMSKEFDGAAWAQNNDTDFRRLIAQAKAKRTATQSSSPTTDAGKQPTSSIVTDLAKASSKPTQHMSDMGETPG